MIFRSVLPCSALTFTAVYGRCTMPCASLFTFGFFAGMVSYFLNPVRDGRLGSTFTSEYSSDGSKQRLLPVARWCPDKAWCDPKQSMKVQICDKKPWRRRQTLCIDVAKYPQIHRRLKSGRAHCGCCPNQCPTCSAGPFNTSEELQEAVDQYLLKLCSGPPIGTWNVSGISEFDFLFSHIRRALDTPAGHQAVDRFNEDISTWDLSAATSTNGMFHCASSFNQPIGAWNTGNVQVMRLMFYDATSFDQDISAWDVSKVVNMELMFNSAASFNHDLSRWTTASLTNMDNMFKSAALFDQDLPWNVSSVTSMYLTFYGALSFNGNVTKWDTSRTANMDGMFGYAEEFNQDLSSWNVAKVTAMWSMFEGASSFNQDLSMWSTSNVTYFNGMFYNASNFNQNLCSWGVSPSVNASTEDMFNNSGCPQQTDPDLFANPPGPFCYSCQT